MEAKPICSKFKTGGDRMKKYVTPVITCVELRVEESVATLSCVVGSCVDYKLLNSDQIASCLIYSAQGSGS